MALTIGLTGDWLQSAGSRLSSSGTIAFDSEYPTGGESLTPAMIGLGTIENIDIEPKTGYTFVYDHTNKKVLVYEAGAGAAAHTHDLLIIGGQAATTTNEVAHYATDILGKEAATNATIAGADSATKGGVVASGSIGGGALAEVAAATNLATLTGVKFRAWGY